MPQKKELRYMAARVTAAADTRKISGYAAKYDTPSKDLGGFTEIIKKGAFTKALQNSPDLIANINHDESLILARPSTTLKLDDNNPIGLYFELEVPETTYGNDLLVNIRSGNYDKCSFAFEVEADKWEKRSSGTVRVIHSFKEIFDIAIVTTPAYQDTSVVKRAFMQQDKETMDRLERAKSYGTN